MTDLLYFFVVGYTLTVLIEAPILYVGLSPEHTTRDRIFAGFWLTACSYPFVIFIIPPLIDPVSTRVLYLAVTETFVPLLECALFAWAFQPRARARDHAVIIAANLASFLTGLALFG